MLEIYGDLMVASKCFAAILDNHHPAECNWQVKERGIPCAENPGSQPGLSRCNYLPIQTTFELLQFYQPTEYPV
ncbi:hypothetical protein MCOR27_009966 [Pyricularia oryzae]|uniref:Uncharacterized protein n=5 Tax=Pyricularia TaxID=48558 RepID=A0ABQ8NGT0_PYRGI|nr:uncharacterized protein MGG_17131 [Pyricularia oryzae 70-15]ELQ34466.1 hypothetical protein OOU_Y34scaffold00765g12 [Pyricularia oryzae Y34]KAH8843800.1 hypothetical protein MCOR01_004583 [Pyricularia oryzae]KAI6295863.1 hypothetical protein MCOR33_007348 [Pyricularia grisea]EHA50463.1 hypothetical protein MGG_17131 [Pyricularia oryzae 70-15]KAH9431275.1 hypothetical protein MCOR02_008572 [Pyricularia oryzae]